MISPEAMERLFARRDADAMLCIHGVRGQAIPTAAGLLNIIRIVAHPALDGMTEEDAGEDRMLVLDLPMTPTTLTLVAGHLDEIMSQTADIALKRMTTEDGHGPSPA